MSYSKFEEQILDVLTKGYGRTWEKLDEETVTEKQEAAKAFYKKQCTVFGKNQSASNYNLLITAMLALQYWNHLVIDFCNTRKIIYML